MLLDLSFTALIITILISLAGSYFMSVWFGGGAQFFIEYIKLFKLDSKIPHVKTFLDLKEQGMPDSYLEYIQANYDNFIVRLITCEKCLAVWISAFLIIPFMIMLSFFNCKSWILFLSFSHLITLGSAFLINKIHQLSK